MNEIIAEHLILVNQMTNEVPEVEGTMMKEIDAVEVVVQVLPASGLRHGLHQVPMLLANGVRVVLNVLGAPEVHLTVCRGVGRVGQGADRESAVVGAENSPDLSSRPEVELHGKVVYVIPGDASILRFDHDVVIGNLGRVEMVICRASIVLLRCVGSHGRVAVLQPALRADRSISVVG